MRRPDKIYLKDRTLKWQLRFEDAHRKMRYKRFTTRKAAEAFAKTVDKAREDGVDPGRKVTFAELVAEWTASHLAQGLRASSTKDYRQSLRRMSEFFGKRELRGIGAADLERLRNELVQRVQAERTERLARVLGKIAATPDHKRTPRQVGTLAREAELRAEIARGGIRAAAKMVGCARTLWKFAVSRGYAPRNIAQDVKKPTAPAAVETDVIDQNILTPGEIERLVAAAPTEHQCGVRFLFMTGMRLGELAGLMWTDLDWATGRVIVRRQRSGLTGELTAPKTRAGTRWIDLPADLIKELKAHRLRTKGELMFPLDERNWRSRVWHPSLRRAGLRAVRIHDARHTHASLLIGAGADVVAVSRRLGHSNPSITLTTYAHAFQRRDTAPLGEKLAAFMKKESGAGCVSVVPTTSSEMPSTEVVVSFRIWG